ncbi:MAG: CapA family protein, partial [Planctomycetes bacterium]|nr:CapA family protein [Planctomycetota bacterium]
MKMKVKRIRVVMFVLFLICFLLGESWGQGQELEQKSEREMTVLLAGDAIITQRWSDRDEPAFARLVEAIRGADVSVVNLEMLIHDFEGYAQADSGGTYMGARPVIARELAWAGFDLCGNANNHTFDYGSIGVLKTVEHVTKAGMLIAGSGKDLQSARAPAIYNSANGKVALLSCSSTFTLYGKASRSRPDIHGRPGLNPLTISTETVNGITRKDAGKLLEYAQAENISGISLRGDNFRFMGVNFTMGQVGGTKRVSRLDAKDVEGNLKAINEAQAKADVVILSLHAHTQSVEIRNFCRQAIFAGADAVYLHGPHEVRGIEIYRNKPIFYSLGD